MHFYFFEGASSGFWNKRYAENAAKDAEGTVSQKRPAYAQDSVHAGKRIGQKERRDPKSTDRRRHTLRADSIGKDFGNENPR